jgi:tRNA (adenine22-N1)-methyltransferase
MNISNRLQIIAELIDSTDKVADIGTDHGKVPVYLVQHKAPEKIYGSDLNEGPLNSAKEFITAHQMTDQIELRLGSGLQPYSPGEINCAIIAGMGGTLIREILEQGKDHLAFLEKLILQPQQGSYQLRQWLVEHQFRIEDEILIQENGIFYEIIYAVPGTTKNYTDLELELGFHLLKKGDETSIAYLNEQIANYERIVENILNNGSNEAKQKATALQKKIDQYNEVKKCLLTQEK